MITADKVMVGPWVAERIGGSWNPQSEAIGLQRDGLVAGVIYENFNRVSVTCHIAIEGLMTPKYLRTIFDYPFNQLGVKTIIAPVGEKNERSIKFVKKLGFRETARLPECHPDGSLLLFTMKRGQCRFIGEHLGFKIESAARS